MPDYGAGNKGGRSEKGSAAHGREDLAAHKPRMCNKKRARERVPKKGSRARIRVRRRRLLAAAATFLVLVAASLIFAERGLCLLYRERLILDLLSRTRIVV